MLIGIYFLGADDILLPHAIQFMAMQIYFTKLVILLLVVATCEF